MTPTSKTLDIGERLSLSDTIRERLRSAMREPACPTCGRKGRKIRTQMDVAAAAGITQGTLSKLLSSDGGTSVYTLDAVAAWLGRIEA